MQKTCIIIAGPTASGKTKASIEIAKHFNTSIISADSRQCFKELNIGVAKPSPSQLNEVPHYFIDSHSIHEPLSAADFEAYALRSVDEIFAKKDIAIMTGGTGLYIKAFCNGLDPIPVVEDDIRMHISESYKKHGTIWLQQEIKERDPLFYTEGEIQNPQRLMRALEVILSSGRSIIEFQTSKIKPRDFKIIKVGLEWPREILYRHINERTDQMMEAGLLAEVESLLPFSGLNALQTVGYRELFSFMKGELSLAHAIEEIKKNTRHYAKRQITWFKRDAEITWVDGNDTENILAGINRSLA